jgi:predicted nucleic acid-binding protein
MEKHVILLDTSILIEALRNKNKQATRLYNLASRGEALAISSITVYEFRNGMTPANETLCEQVLSSMTILPFDDNAARIASVIYQTLKSQHNLIDIADILIAATAIVHHFTHCNAECTTFPAYRRHNVCYSVVECLPIAKKHNLSSFLPTIMPSFFCSSRLSSRVFCVLLSVLCLWCGSAMVSSAQTQPDMVWEQTGGPIEGGDIRSFAVYGTSIFVGTGGGGVFRSSNNGASWIATGLTSTTVYALAVSGSTIFAGTSGGVFLSIDNGASWTAASSGLTSTTVYALAISGSTIFAGTYNDGVFRSSDKGRSWTAASSGLTNKYVWSLVVSGSVLFAGTEKGVVRSTDNGTSWTADNTILRIEYVRSLAVRGNTLFAGTEKGLFRSSDNGASWIAVSGLTNISVEAFVVSDSTMFAGTSGGVFRSSDNGSSWTAVNTGLTNRYARSLVISGNTLFAGTGGNGVFRATIPTFSPTLTASPTSLVLRTVQLGTAGAPQSYMLTGKNLATNSVTVTAPAGVELATTTTGAFSTMLTLPTVNGSISAVIYARLNSSTPQQATSSIVNRSGSTQASVIVTGNIIPLPQLTATPLQPENLDTIIHFDPSRGGAYSLTGSFLDAPVSVSAPQGVLLFDQTNKTWTQTLTLQPDAAGNLMQTVSVRLDSSRLGSVRDSIRNVSGSTSASVSVRGAVVPLTLPPGAETTLELRFVGQQPLRLRDTARVQIWLKDSRLLTPRLVGRFLRTLRVTVRIDTNNLAVLGISSLTPRARIESPQRVPANTPLYTILAERPDTISTSNLLLAEMTVLATLGATTTNTIRIAEPVQWLGSDGSITPASAVRILREPESVAVQIRPLFLRRSSTIAVVAPNPSSDVVQVLYTLSPENCAATSAVTLTISDAAGRTVKRMELGERQTGVAQQETVRLGDLPTGAYVLMLLTPLETLPCRLDVVR